MIPATCKRLIEVDFPIAAVSEHSAREKSIRHGHPSTLHLWWARRPLAACRSVLLGLLLPDPCDTECPKNFKNAARELLAKRYGSGTKSDEELRELLLKFIGEFANWDHAANAMYLEIGRGLVKAAHPEETPVVVDPFSGGGSIPLEALRLGCDAFASDLNPVACLILKTLLEDLPRYGNAEFKLTNGKGKPIVVRGLADALRHVGKQVKEAAEKELAQYYPVDLVCPQEMIGKPCRVISIQDQSTGTVFFQRMDEELSQVQVQPKGAYYYVPTKGTPPGVGVFAAALDAGMNLRADDPKLGEKLASIGAKRIPEARPIAYIWARTVRCEGIGCGAEIPLVKSFWLSQKPNRKQALRFQIERPKSRPPHVAFEIFRPKTEQEIPPGTVNRANATCPCCNTVLPAERVTAQIALQHGGADAQFDAKSNRVGGAILLAVVTLREDAAGRSYRLPTPKDYEAVFAAHKAVAKLPAGLVPDEPTPKGGGRGAGRAFGIQRYGMMTFGDLFTARQKISLVTLCKLIGSSDGAIRDLLALVIDRVSSRSSSLCLWRYHADQEKVEHIFGRQTLPVVWDFAEAVVMSESTGSFSDGIEVVAQCIDSESRKLASVGQVQMADACASPLPDGSAAIWLTDPPYYDAIPYSDLSDFFFVWLKRALPHRVNLSDPYDKSNLLTPKVREIVQDEIKSFEGRPKDREFFENVMGRAFGESRRVLRNDGVGCVVFAHKTTEGWEALLSGMMRAGWQISASWPITTEMKNRLRARESAALAGSVHLVCRPRPAQAGVGDWSEVKAAMEKRIREWLPTLLKHGVRGADAIFSCLGPALESYSRYEKVLTAADREVPLGGDPDASEPHERGFLAYVFETLSKEALRQVLGDAETEGFEEDSRMTALFLWTLQATKANADAKKKPDVTEESDEEAGDDEDDGKPKKAKAGFSMPFDTFIRITRPMGIHYAALEDRVIEIEKGIVRLLSVRERSGQLLGEAATRPGIEISLEDVQQMELGLLVKRQDDSAMLAKSKRGKKVKVLPGQAQEEAAFTTLDRIHRAMLLFALGRSNLLRQVLEKELRQNKRFEHLALSLNALYPDGSDERRMLEGVQAAMRGVK